MAWHTLADWVAGAVLRASQLNEQLRDNMAETAPAKATTAGQLFRSIDVNSIEPFAGADGDIVRVVAGVPDFVATAGLWTAADIADRTRSFFLYAEDFFLTNGSPALGVISGTTATGWAFDGAAQEDIIAMFTMPADYVSGAIALKLHWTRAAGSSGDVMWRASLKDFADGGALSTSGETTATDTITAPSAGSLKISTLSVAFTPTAGRLAYLRIDRRADQAGDTLNGIDSYLIGCEVSYLADM